ncbi:MAG: hypothetical protein IPF67_16415 [Saprospiraceae bacterium]|nr:hypothetical protein [Candidatus Brachybacter algidus]
MSAGVCSQLERRRYFALHAIRIPGTSLTTFAIEMQNELEEAIKRFPGSRQSVLQNRHFVEIATDPMPPSVAEMFYHPKLQWNGQACITPAELVAAMEQAVRANRNNLRIYPANT